ncbi:uncharacterized ATP-dependent helicase C29A10.10c isoform X3 [Oryza sativa Japonica Group]
MLGCKLWLRTTLSPNVMRNTLLGHCFHTRDEKSHKEIFDLFLPFLQSLEALQDGDHEKQRRNILYFLLYQVTRSSNFSSLMRKTATKIALLIVQRGYTMNPPCPASECVHMWGPSLIGSLKDKSLHNSLRQPALDLINILIISDASALISFKMKYESFTKGDVINSVIFVDDDDELPVFCDAEEMDYGCWNDFNVLYKLTCRECKDWRCVPLLWYLIMVQLEPSELPMAFSKAVFWALSHISVLEPGVSTESSVPVNDWLSSHAGEVLPTFSWQVPNGADDGGVGKECINTLKVSQSCTLLLKIFKRFAIHVIMQIEQRGLLKQWAWESMMAESLILTLVDHNDNLRQVGRAVLELASQGRGLTSGLQFLCSSASSLTATFLGLRYAVQSVETKSVLADFPSLHHLFFVICKLLKDVVVQQPSVALQAKPFEGGFLRQSFSNVSVNLPQHSVDIISWEKFSTLLSGALWPFIFTCLRKGDDLINTKQCQISCVRLLELVPLVYERVSSYSSAKSCGVPTMVLDPTDITWLFHLINWGKSSLLVIIRHWKQCMLSLIKILKGSLGGTVQHYIEDLGSIISHDAVNIDELSEKISDLKLALSKEASAKSERRVVAGVSMFTEPIAGIPSPATQTAQERNTGRDNVETMKSSRSTCTEHIILLSDSEENSLTADVSGEDVLSSVKDSDGSGTSDMQKEVEHSEPRMPTEDRHVSLKQQICSPASDIVASSKPVSKDRSIIAAKEGLGRAKIPTVPVNTNDTSLLPKKIKPPASTISQPSRSNLSSGAEKFKSIFRDLSDDEDDPLEHALDSCRKPQIRLTKSCLLVPKRQVVQLPLSAEKRHTSGRPDASSRRLKPPKLDSWFKNILEMDYFAVVGLPSSEIIKKLALKEIPVCFDSQAQYVEIFQPLVLEEFKAQLQNAYVETPAEDMNCGSISILSVERVDEFLVVRGRPDKNDCLKSKNCMENDLILLSKDPLNSSGQQVHVLGKVDRRESDKTKALILVIKFFLSNENARLNKVKRLLVERSKWFLNRIMSMTPQVREFSALSSLNDIPVLPVILNPVSCKSIHHGSGKVHLDKLSHPMRKVLKSSYNDSQLEAVSIAIRSTSLKAKFDLSLIQGPPGTGKTRTIVAIVSALLSLHAANSSQRNESFASAEFNKPRPRLSQSVAVTRAWQDAALAKQLINDSQREVPTDRLSKGRVLVCAQSNAAVDELVSRLSEGLYDTDGKLYKPYIVRVGNAKTVHSNSVPFFIDTLVEQRLADELKKNNDSKSLSDTESSSSLRANLEKIVDRIRYYELRRKLLEADKTENDSLVPSDYETDEVSDDAIGAKLNFLYAQKRKVSAELATAHAREKKIADENRFLKHKVRKSILGEAEIVVTTLSGCGGDIYSVCSETASANKFVNFSEHALFDVVVIDEAAQALEPATLIPLQLLKSKGTKCIMVGDPKQLPATVMSGLASKFLYECSMFERLQRAGYPVIMLTKQYRMHPEISRFPSLHFYENKLLDGAQAADKSAPFHGHDCLGPYMFFDVADGREQCGKNAATQSLCNQFEAEAALEILGFLKNRYPSEFSCRKIGIITPYRSQLSLLRSRFNSFFGPEIVAEMEINTVDGFQGREVDILVLSTVRASNSSDSRHHTGEARSIGFVADVRRMNVALTRARFSLWIVGNAKTLQTNSHWASLLQNAKERNLFISVNRPYRSLFEKVRSHSEDIHGSRHTYYTSHCKKKESGKNSMTNSQKIDARPHKEHARHTVRTVETANERLPNDQAKRASRWDRKSPKAHEPFHRKSSKEKEPVIQDTDQDNAVRKEKEGEGLTIHNDNSLELANVIRQRELNKPVKPNIHTDAGKTLCNQDSLQNSEVRKDVNKKYDNGNVKGSQNHDTKATVMKIDASPPAQDMQKLIQKAKGARKFSEKPRFGNSSQVDSSVKHEATLESANKNGGACTPTNSEMKKMAGKAKKARRFSEHPRSGNSNKVDHSLPSFDEESSQMPELKENNLTATRQNHLTASRKRQREDIESLLSSALVSSKKPSSKCPSKKQK